jgi:hypothetical protein
MIFKERTTAPATNNKYYIHKSKGGLNECIIINKTTGSCLPNCVAWAWARAYESWGIRPKLSRGNAEDWWGFKDGYQRGKTPKVGSVICWRKGKAGYSKDGAGHVAFVERVNSDGTILTSNSNYSGTRFFLRTLSPKDDWHIGTGLTFQGFIYPPVKFAEKAKPSKITLTNADYPTTIRKGNYFTIQGKLTSALPMSKVQVAIIDAKTTGYLYKYQKTLKGVKTFDVHKADQTMMFRKLKKGTYYYRIMAWDSNGGHTVLKKKFVVK